MKPRIFVGYSKDYVCIAESVKRHLSNDFDVNLWTDPHIFIPSENIFSALIEETKKSDFAILIFSPDDKIKIKGEEKKIPRDNVVFEYGLFLGALGQRRVVHLRPAEKNIDLRIPTDLGGVLYETYDINLPEATSNGSNLLNKFAENATRDASEKIRQQFWDYGLKDGPTHVCVICYKIEEKNKIKYLLVKTKKEQVNKAKAKRRIFPKGEAVNEEEDLNLEEKRAAFKRAAIKHAIDKAGVSGKFRPNKSQETNFKGKKVEAYLLWINDLMWLQNGSQPREEFRDPKWFELNEALEEVSKNRSGEYKKNLLEVPDWADREIKEYHGIIND